MYEKGMRIYVAQINPIVGHLDYNTDKIIASIREAKNQKADVVLFPELTICGYPPEDLLLYKKFVHDVGNKLAIITKETQGLFVAVGLIRENPSHKEKLLYNSCAILCDGKLLGYKDKTLLPTYDIFDERRYFEPGDEQKVWEYKGKKIGILICEDIWQHAGLLSEGRYHRDPVKELAGLKPDLVLNLSASPYYFEKKDVREEVFSTAVKTLHAPLVWCNQVGANDQLVFDGYSMYFNQSGEVEQIAKGFVEDRLIIELESKLCCCHLKIDPFQNLFSALVLGVKDYFSKQGFTKACLGLSGGLDSAIVAILAKEALGVENVLAISMPSRFTSEQTRIDTEHFLQNIPISYQVIPMDKIFQHYLDLLEPHFEQLPYDSTEENLQARIRGMILMAFSNKFGSVLLSSGNKSEAAMGYSTLYGDLCGGLGVILDVKKTTLYQLGHWINRNTEVIPKSILTKAPSAELRENQKDQDTLPEYEILDQIITDYVENCLSIGDVIQKRGFSADLVQEVVYRFHKAEYKRRQSPPAIRVTKKSFSKGRIFPIVQSWI